MDKISNPNKNKKINDVVSDDFLADVHNMPTDKLCELFYHSKQVIKRKVFLDELKSRNYSAFVKFVQSDSEDPTEFFCVMEAKNG